MAIVVSCPHCETKFNLQPDMVGKSMRCPNLDCRQVFTVKPQGREIEPPKSEPVPVPQGRPMPLPPEPGKGTRKPAIVDAQIVEAAVVSPKVKEVVWSEGADLPPGAGPGRARLQAEPLDGTDEQPILRRKKKKSRGPLVLIGMIVVGVLVAGGIVFYLARLQVVAQENLAKQAADEYGKGEHAAAQKTYEKLLAEYPDSEEAPRYRFFADLAQMQVAVRSVTNRENPDAAIERFKQFLTAQKESEFARPKSGFGSDILEAGRKLGEDVAGHADDRVKAFRADRSGKPGELDRAEKAVATGRELLPMMEAFRTPDDRPLDSIRADLDTVESSIKRERERTAAIARARRDLENLTDANIQRVENDLAGVGFESDDEARSIIAAAKGKLLELVRYEPDPAEPRTPPTSSAATILFVSPIGSTRRVPASGIGEEAPPSVFLAVARGILYAINEEGGALLWALRVGTDITDPPTVARVELPTGPTDIAVIASNVAGVSSVSAYVVRTGASLWFQPLGFPNPKKPDEMLSIPAAGPPVVVGSRVLVPLRDEQGTIFEFDLSTGTRRGRIRLGQPVGQNAISVRPGTGLLYAVADARRVYVIDAGARDDDGNPLPLRCVQVIATGHLPGTVRTPPLLLGPEGDAPADRWMILSQAAGRSMLLRAFTMQPIAPPALDGKAPPESPASPSVELPVDGWSWFPLVSDGERVAVATDFGQFRLFGVKQLESLDRSLFALPDRRPPMPSPAEGRAIRGVVFPAEEAAFWVVANGNLQKYRVGLVPSRGVEILPVGEAVPIGEPTQPPQTNHRRDAACLIVRSPDSSGYKAVLVDLRDGQQRWQRQLGVAPAATPIPQGDGLLLVAEDGGMVLIPAASGATAGRNIAAPPEWLIAAPPENATGPTAVASDGKTVFTVTPVVVREDQKEIAKFVVRRVSDGRVVHEGTATAPGSLAGQPAILGDGLLLPLSDGFIYRHNVGARPNPDTLTAGPLWAGERRSADAVCHITPLSASAFLTSNGSKKLTKWDWPASGRWSPTGLSMELRERPAGPGVLLPSGDMSNPLRFLIADVTGSVWMFDAARAGQPTRRWRPGGVVPAGQPTSPLIAQTDSSGRTLVAYTSANRFLVCLDPEREAHLWAVRTGDDPEAALVGAPQVAPGGRWIVTDLAGRVSLYGSTAGKAEITLEIRLPGAVPAVAGGLLGSGAVLTALSDGSSVVIPLPAAGAPIPKQ